MSPNISGLTCTNTSRTPAYCCSLFKKCLISFRFRRPYRCAWAFWISSIASLRSSRVAYWNLLLRSGVKRRLKLSHTRLNEVLIVAATMATRSEGMWMMKLKAKLEIKSKVGRTKAGKKLVTRRSVSCRFQLRKADAGVWSYIFHITNLLKIHDYAWPNAGGKKKPCKHAEGSPKRGPVQIGSSKWPYKYTPTLLHKGEVDFGGVPRFQGSM